MLFPEYNNLVRSVTFLLCMALQVEQFKYALLGNIV